MTKVANIKTKWNEFFQDLDLLILNGHLPGEVHKKDLEYVSNELTKLRTRSLERSPALVGELYSKDKDNPAFLPTSLLRILDGTGLREVAHTRILAWAFDPERAEDEHGLPRDLFLSVLDRLSADADLDWPAGEYEIGKVEAERYTSCGRRIDIWVEGHVTTAAGEKNQWLVVIEAKIAAQLTDQLQYYETEARAWQRAGRKRLNPSFVFLKDGSPVDDVVSSEDWLPLSFKTLFELLWARIREHPEAPGYHLARHYLSGVLADVQGWTLPLKASTTIVDYQMIEFCLDLNPTSERCKNG